MSMVHVVLAHKEATSLDPCSIWVRLRSSDVSSPSFIEWSDGWYEVKGCYL